MARTVQEIREHALALLRQDYPSIKEGVYRLEVFMRQKSRKAVYELRDFLDHLCSLYRDDISPEDAEKHFQECRTHLRRCAVEPLEYMAEKRFVQLDLYARWFAMVPFVFRDNPLSKPEFFQRMREAKGLIAEGRIAKTEGRACQLMDQAFGVITDLLAQVQPLRYIIAGLCWLIGVLIVGVIGGLAAAYFAGQLN